MVYLSHWLLCPLTFSPLIHYLCTTPHREQPLIMLSRQLCSLGLAMSMQALCFQLHLTLNGLGVR